eukprot:scaffold1117_cov167-Amphora_coffeaeformis.AAC.12
MVPYSLLASSYHAETRLGSTEWAVTQTLVLSDASSASGWREPPEKKIRSRGKRADCHKTRLPRICLTIDELLSVIR